MTENRTETPMRVFFEWLLTLFAALYFVAWGLIISLLSLLIRPLLSNQNSQILARYTMHYLLKSFFFGLGLTRLFELDSAALDCLKNEKGLLIAPNHPCLMDALFVCSRLPNVVCVMKASVLNNPVLFGGAWLGGFIRSDSATRFVQQCEQTLREGQQLLLFPEGTRSLNYPVNAFKGGFALIAQKSGAQIQTVLIEANTTFLGKNWPLIKRPPFPLKYRVTLGRRFELKPGEKHKNLTKEMETYFIQNLADLKYRQ